MKLPDVVLLAGFSSRALVYFQLMRECGMLPCHVILFGIEDSYVAGKDIGKIKRIVDDPRINLSLSLIDECKNSGCPYTHITQNSVNCPEIFDALTRLKPALVIYAGYGSQIVGKTLLAVAPFLHVHAGWLPEEKGSTTLYYSILKNRCCSASAILLSSDLDGGPILARERYPIPRPEIEIDHYYDSYIRADLLVRVLQDYYVSGKLPDPIDPTENETMYYVIHPILKHIAILSLDKNFC
ncbi:MAG: hypothetical protein WC626_01370 [Methanoregula sp.]